MGEGAALVINQIAIPLGIVVTADSHAIAVCGTGPALLMAKKYPDITVIISLACWNGFPAAPLALQHDLNPMDPSLGLLYNKEHYQTTTHGYTVYAGTV